MTTNHDQARIAELEAELRRAAHQITQPAPGECLVCYVYRMLGEFSCAGLHWALRYRDAVAPNATALRGRLMSRGAGCDCEIFWNGYQPRPDLMVYDRETGYWELPEQMPPCVRVRRGSTQPCRLWEVKPIGW